MKKSKFRLGFASGLLGGLAMSWLYIKFGESRFFVGLLSGFVTALVIYVIYSVIKYIGKWIKKGKTNDEQDNTIEK